MVFRISCFLLFSSLSIFKDCDGNLDAEGGQNVLDFSGRGVESWVPEMKKGSAASCYITNVPGRNRSLQSQVSKMRHSEAQWSRP